MARKKTVNSENEATVTENKETENSVTETAAEIPAEPQAAATVEASDNKEEAPEQDSNEETAAIESNKSKKAKKEKKPREKVEFSVKGVYGKLSASIPTLVITCAAAILFMIIACLAAFFTNIKGAEKVLVPNVIGKNWDEGLLELQAKQLYAKINLRYSDVPGDAGQILDQSPSSGAIVKGYSRVDLVISRGVVVDEIQNFVGRNFSDVQMELQTLFAGQTKPLIVIDSPEYKPNAAEAGTILEQDPPEGYQISEPVTLKLVVSRGPTYENTKRPYVIGQTIEQMLNTMANSKIIFDISTHEAREDETPGVVTSQETITTEYVPNYTRVSVEMAVPAAGTSETVQGVYQTVLMEYPFPVNMRLEAQPLEGAAYTIIDFVHSGGNLTIPYNVSRGTTLILYVADKVRARTTIE